MISFVLREPTEADLDYLAENMREPDRLECRVVGGVEPREGLTECVEQSLWSYVVEVEGKPIAVFGVAPHDLLGDVGSPWLLSAEGIERNARVVMSVSQRFKALMQAQFETLSNIVHAHNRSAIRYLKWCGFKFGETIQVKGEPFIAFEWTRGAA